MVQPRTRFQTKFNPRTQLKDYTIEIVCLIVFKACRCNGICADINLANLLMCLSSVQYCFIEVVVVVVIDAKVEQTGVPTASLIHVLHHYVIFSDHKYDPIKHYTIVQMRNSLFYLDRVHANPWLLLLLLLFV